jgi:glycosyltransferase involved in cell wall biosynthesis
MDDIAILIPSLNPDEKLVGVVQGLAAAGFGEIVVVNDGSGEGYLAPFQAAAGVPGCRVIAHEGNKGKGRALKTGFAYILKHRPDIAGVMTVDGDGQHRSEDVARCAEALRAHGGSLILGVRDFGGKQVPLRSRLGNRITSFVFRAVCGARISDTQTGLRGIPGQHLGRFCQIDGERFEYETNMLLVAGREGIPIHEAVIATVYLEGNASSHFRVLRDSMMIYRQILHFAFGKKK